MTAEQKIMAAQRAIEQAKLIHQMRMNIAKLRASVQAIRPTKLVGVIA